MALVRVTNIQHGCVNDGPGVRTTVFLKGCPLRCPWCCNPETQSVEHEAFVDETKCILLKGVYSILCKNCIKVAGREPINKCRFGVYEEVAKDYTEEELLKEILIDQDLYKISNGGVTFSGGEPLGQSKALAPIMNNLREGGISIALETTLYVPKESIELVVPYVDYWIVDVKLQPEMKLNDSFYKEQIQSNITFIRNHQADILFRLVYVNSLEGKEDDVVSVILKWGISDLEIIQCHYLGNYKYEKLGIMAKDFTPDDIKFESFCEKLTKKGIVVNKLKI